MWAIPSNQNIPCSDNVIKHPYKDKKQRPGPSLFFPVYLFIPVYYILVLRLQLLYPFVNIYHRTGLGVCGHGNGHVSYLLCVCFFPVCVCALQLTHLTCPSCTSAFNPSGSTSHRRITVSTTVAVMLQANSVCIYLEGFVIFVFYLTDLVFPCVHCNIFSIRHSSPTTCFSGL